MTGVKRKTRKAVTLDVLKGHFLGYDPKSRRYTLCTEYLNDSIILYMDNDRETYNAMVNKRRKPEGIAWGAFMKLVDDYISSDYIEPGTVYYASSQHLKDFLMTYGEGYESIADSVKHVKEVRKDLLAWDKKNGLHFVDEPEV